MTMTLPRMPGRLIRIIIGVVLALVPIALISSVGSADHLPTDTIRVTVTNDTGQLLSPPAIIAAPHEWRPLMDGEPASEAIEELAENGNPGPIVEQATADVAYVAMASDAPLAPGETRYYEFDSPVWEVDLWVMAMAVFTNDGFFVAHAPHAPGELNDIIVDGLLLDAGTEVNTEAASDVPGLGGTDGMDENGVVHFHKGLTGTGDVDPHIYSLDGGFQAIYQRASTPVNPGPTPQLETYAVTIQNWTHAQAFAPPVIAVVEDPTHPFTIGEPASPGLQLLAETGDNSLLAEEWAAAGAFDVIALSDPVAPGSEVTVYFDAPKQGYVVWCAMLVWTNDGFTCGGDMLAKELQTTGGVTYAYDAGTEVNTEAAGDVPGLGGNGHQDENGTVDMHAGIHGGADLDPEVYGWDGPVSHFSVMRSETPPADDGGEEGSEEGGEAAE